MKTIEELVELESQKAAQSSFRHLRWWRLDDPPPPDPPVTVASVAHIETQLGIVIPQDFIKYSNLAPGYHFRFVSIGEDFSNSNHIINLNQEFHQAGDAWALPDTCILINHGHDGDCECFDISGGSQNGEYPICFVDLESPTIKHPVAKSFREFLEKLITRI